MEWKTHFLLLWQIVMDMLAEKFNEQLSAGVDVRTFPRAVGKLRKEAERVKDVLSANQAYQVCLLKGPEFGVGLDYVMIGWVAWYAKARYDGIGRMP